MTVRIAACQIDVSLGEVDRNLERIERSLGEAAQLGALLAVLPEASVTGYMFDSLDDAVTVARRANAVAPDRLAAFAERYGLALICGSLEAIGEAVRNVIHVVASDGRRFKYSKAHLPFLGVDRFATPGDDPPAVYELSGLRVGIVVCYELRFPEAARICALEGADILAVPTNWPVGVEFHPEIFAPVRAAENHCYLLAADRVGTEQGTRFMGRSILLDYDGVRLATGSDTEEEVIFGDIDSDAARKLRVEGLDTIADRRPGLYRRLLSPGADRLHPPGANLFSGDVE